MNTSHVWHAKVRQDRSWTPLCGAELGADGIAYRLEDVTCEECLKIAAYWSGAGGTKMSKIALGDRVEDVVSGTTGIVTGIASYITGCDQACVVPPAKEGREYVHGTWIDVTRLVVVKAGVVKLPGASAEAPSAAPGGPATDAPRRR